LCPPNRQMGTSAHGQPHATITTKLFWFSGNTGNRRLVLSRPPALGAGGPEFKSRRPDQFFQRVIDLHCHLFHCTVAEIVAACRLFSIASTIPANLKVSSFPAAKRLGTLPACASTNSQILWALHIGGCFEFGCSSFKFCVCFGGRLPLTSR